MTGYMVTESATAPLAISHWVVGDGPRLLHIRHSRHQDPVCLGQGRRRQCVVKQERLGHHHASGHDSSERDCVHGAVHVDVSDGSHHHLHCNGQRGCDGLHGHRIGYRSLSISHWVVGDAPASYTFATAGSKTLYAWAKDAAGNVSTSRSASVSITLQATVPEPAGWYAGDMHVHRSCGGTPEDVSSILQKMNPQNLAVVSLLADMGNGEVQNPVTDLPLVTGQDDPISTSNRIVHWDAEWHWDATYTQYPHQALGGHVLALGLTEAHQIWDEYTYPILTWARQQGGIAGFAHMQYLDDGIPQSLNCCIPIEYPVEVALGSADFISEDVNGSDSFIQAYYRLLNTGFRPGFAAGTDYPCGVSELGSLLTYAQVPAGQQMTYRQLDPGHRQRQDRDLAERPQRIPVLDGQRQRHSRR